MVIKKFVARTLPEALTKVKKDFGEEAVILKTRFNNKNAAQGDTKVVEVTAAIENESVKTNRFKPQVAVSEKVPAEAAVNRIKGVQTGTTQDKPSKEVERQAIAASTDKKQPKPEPEDKTPAGDIEIGPLPSELLAQIKNEISIIKSNLEKKDTGREFTSEISTDIYNMVGDIRKEIGFIRKKGEESIFGQPRPAAVEFMRSLIARQIPEKMAIEAVRRLPDGVIDGDNMTIGWESLAEVLSGYLEPGQPIQLSESGPTVVMLVGPTGSGKSSAAARLAFRYSMNESCPVALITTDNFRADSKEQLSSLARVIGCSFTSASSVDELSVLLKKFKEELVIIDTSGVSNRQDMAELSALAVAAVPQEVHLVVPADISSAELHSFIQDYPEIGIDKVLVTKLDQTGHRGGIIGAAAGLGLKFSFESSSRELPGDFRLFDPESFVSAIKPVFGKEKEGLD